MADEVLNGDSNLSANDILDALKDEVIEDEVDDSTDEEPAEVEDDSTDDDSEEEEQPEEKPEEEIELNDEDEDNFEYQDVPNRQAILKAYPEIFKKFPGIERAIYRESEYTKLFPSIGEAKQAQERLENFSRLENDVFQGNIGGLLSSVKSSDPKAFGKIAGTLLNTLSSVDKDAYFNVVNRVIKTAIKAAADTGKNSNTEDGEQLHIAAQLLHRFIYNTHEITAPDNIVTEDRPDPREAELTKREVEFNQRQLGNAVEDVRSRTESTIKSAVEKYIDPKGMMNSYTRDKAIADVLTAVNNDIMNDTRFRGHLDRLWVDAQKKNYSDESKKKIREAVIRKAQSTLPGFIKNVRAKVLKNKASVKPVSKKETEQRSKPTFKRTATSNERPVQKPRANSVNGILRALE